MKISILVPTDEYRNYAGARIRYGRISENLATLNHSLELVDITEFDLDLHECDTLIISKCYDARSLVIANALADRGKLIGIDLFDDYFSQTYDSRLSRFRNWLSQAVEICDFALCSTSAMARVANGYRSNLPTYVMNDPADDIQPADFGALLSGKLAEARDKRQIGLCWYGVGDNPHFPVGLGDLSAFGGMLQHLLNGGYDVTLTVLTNRRALDADRLGMLRALPVKTVVQTWSAPLEAETLRTSFACFLPVNAQNFSAAKSLNRAITALTAGCQVLSAGYPLYQSLDQLIYRRADNLIRDMELGDMRLSAARLDQYLATLSDLASPTKEAEGLASFLSKLAEAKGDVVPTSSKLTIIHGIGTNGGAHKIVQKLDGLSVALPHCTAKLGFDVIVMAPAASAEIALRLSRRGLSKLLPDAQKDAVPNQEKTERPTWVLGKASAINRSSAAVHPSLPVQLAFYNAILKETCDHLKLKFPLSRILLSENSLLPFNFDTSK